MRLLCFRIFHCCEINLQDYVLYREYQDGDKKIFFIIRQHFQYLKFMIIFNSLLIVKLYALR